MKELISEVQNALPKKKSSHCGWGLSAGQKDVHGVLIFSLHNYYILSAYCLLNQLHLRIRWGCFYFTKTVLIFDHIRGK